MKVAVLGVGLIGGSIGLAARRRTGAYVIGYDREASALSNAVELGAIDEPAFAISDAVREADVVFIATPVGAAEETALLALEAAGSECALSDVGSTKRAIVGAISDPRFVGGHPLAGAETAGVASAREDLFEGATWYLTPAAGAAWSAVGAGSHGGASEGRGEGGASVEASVDAAPWAVERLRGLIERLGGRPAAIAPDAHDRLMASVSHLPHVLANVLVAQAARSIEAKGTTLGPDVPLGSGPSFRDATRVAGANTAIWTDIYLSNRDLLAEALDGAIHDLSAVRDALSAGDAQRLAAWNERARTERTKLRQAGLVSGS
jgi:prephenate dehydrogenase